MIKTLYCILSLSCTHKTILLLIYKNETHKNVNILTYATRNKGSYVNKRKKPGCEYKPHSIFPTTENLLLEDLKVIILFLFKCTKFVHILVMWAKQPNIRDFNLEQIREQIANRF